VAAPAVNLIDDFNRASLGSNWSDFSGAGASALAINASTTLAKGGANYCGSFYNVSTFTRPCETYLSSAWTYVGGSLYFGLALYINPTGTFDGYKIGTDTDASPDRMVLYRTDDGSDTELGSHNITVASGDRFALQLDATHVRMWIDDGGAGWAEVASAADTTYSSSLAITIDIFDTGGTDILLDNLNGGAISGAVAAIPSLVMAPPVAA
jgi:hypothetical protein